MLCGGLVLHEFNHVTNAPSLDLNGESINEKWVRGPWTMCPEGHHQLPTGQCDTWAFRLKLKITCTWSVFPVDKKGKPLGIIPFHSLSGMWRIATSAYRHTESGPHSISFGAITCKKYLLHVVVRTYEQNTGDGQASIVLLSTPFLLWNITHCIFV